MLWTEFNRLGAIPDPWRSLERLNKAASDMVPARALEFPAINLWSDGDSLVATMELPGIEPNTVDISVVGNSLSIQAQRPSEQPQDGESYHRRERWSGQASRTIDLPYSIDSEKVSARFSKGVLKLALPRAEAEKPKKIVIENE